MSRYIDLEEFEKRINNYIKPETLEEKALIEWCKDECIRQAYCMPTADVVEVVRCKDCKYYDDGECEYHSEPKEQRMYERWTVDVNENDYCSYGERREK